MTYTDTLIYVFTVYISICRILYIPTGFPSCIYIFILLHSIDKVFFPFAVLFIVLYILHSYKKHIYVNRNVLFFIIRFTFLPYCVRPLLNNIFLLWYFSVIYISSTSTSAWLKSLYMQIRREIMKPWASKPFLFSFLHRSKHVFPFHNQLNHELISEKKTKKKKNIP